MINGISRRPAKTLRRRSDLGAVCAAVLFGLLAPATGASQGNPHGKITIACADCHTTDSWKMRPDAKFDHASTGFNLAGQHRFLECRGCHEGLRFEGTKRECLTCHTDVHNAELGTACSRCHTLSAWVVPDMRQKHQETRFPLAGRHLSAECEDCHDDVAPRRYASTSPECISCHRQEYEATVEPSHTVSGFTVECANCHKITSPAWKGSFDHNLTAFPLTGAHRALICAECHPGNNFGKLPTDCYSCHEDDYRAVLSPNHLSGGFSTACQTCHTTAAWSPATFNHSATAFALTGAHAGTPCEQCHVGGNYALTYTDCYQCHSQEYAGALNPDHASGGFDHNCATCHSTTAWEPASFNHATTRFPLTGAHVTTACLSCHAGGDYRLTYTDCYACHQSDYAAPADPNHVTANFSHDCTPCHTTSAWLPSTFNHDAQYFRIYSGRHAGRWPSCSTCHDAPADYGVFTCISCHEHDQANTDDRHTEVNNYLYNRTSCYTCHRNV